MEVPAYSDNSHYTVSVNNGASWTNVGLSGQSDPGSGSSTVLIPITQFDIPYGNVGIGTSSPSEQLQITGNLSLPATTATTGIYKSGVNTFIHSYGTNNFFAGVNAGNLTLTGSCNVGVGTQALTSMTLAGTDNVGVGYQSLYSLTKGSFNVGIGYQALFSDIGLSPGQAGNNNVGIGLQALYSNVSGYDNVAVGNNALTLNTGNYNTALGHNAGASFAANTNNTFIGYGANAGANNLTNATAIGNGTIVAASATIMAGNAITNFNIPVGAVYGGSDGRFKFNIKQEVKGLAFINKLCPVTYQVNTKQLDDFLIQNLPDSVKILHKIGMDFAPSTAVIHSGFIAQSVDSAANACGFTSSIVHKPTSSSDYYALSYSEIVVPLVKAVQELSKTNDSLKRVAKSTDSLLTVVQTQLTTTTTNLQQQITSCCAKGSVDKSTGDNSTDPSTDVELASKSAILYQNMPNPFRRWNSGKIFRSRKCYKRKHYIL